MDGTISGQQITQGRDGTITFSMSVMGIGINAQVEIYLSPGSSSASATIYPNFNSNTVWLRGNVVPYENSNIFEGMSL